MAKPKALGYVRVSTDEQAAKGYGLDIQRAAIRDYCKEHGLALADILSDEGISGSNGIDTRIGLADVRQRAVNGEVKAVVIYRVDRLARDLGLQEMFMTDMRRAGVEVLSVTEPDIDSEDGTRVLMRQMLGAISQYERWTIRQRMTAGQAAKRAAGGYAGGRPSYGLVAKDGALVPDPREQEAVALIARLHREGSSLRQIAVKLDEAGYSPKVGARWQPNQIRRILQRL